VGDTVPGKTSAYKLTLMKKLSQSTKPSNVKERVVDLSLVAGLYDQLSPTLSPSHSCREGSGTTPRASCARRSSSQRAGMTPTRICTSSPSSRTSFTGFRTTWWMCR
jgi:hypothetical protein